MFVCLCNGVTSQIVARSIAAGAATTNEISNEPAEQVPSAADAGARAAILRA